MPHNQVLLKSIFSKELLDSGKRLSSSSISVETRLNRNESAYDVSEEVKEKVLSDLSKVQWKNYPPPYYNKLEELIAKYNRVKPEQVVPGAGSANIITSVLNYFAINRRQIVIAHPSFSLYEYHCKTYGIEYELWELNSSLEYDLDNLPDIKENGLVLFASPNNPVGNIMSGEKLITLLKKYPHTIFMLDEVYNEFCEGDNASLLEEYANLVLLRSFSKTFSCAGLRIGYLLADSEFATNFRKLIIPFTLNIISVSYVESILNSSKEIAKNKQNIAETILERERVYDELMNADPSSQLYSVSTSFGNFLLIRFINTEFYRKINEEFEEKGIKVLDVSNVTMLGAALRITIGKPEENNRVIEVFKSIL